MFCLLSRNQIIRVIRFEKSKTVHLYLIKSEETRVSRIFISILSDSCFRLDISQSYYPGIRVSNHVSKSQDTFRASHTNTTEPQSKLNAHLICMKQFQSQTCYKLAHTVKLYSVSRTFGNPHYLRRLVQSSLSINIARESLHWANIEGTKKKKGLAIVLVRISLRAMFLRYNTE